MAQAFNLTAQLNLRGPANIRQIAAQIRRDLGNINASVKFKIDPATTRNVAGLNSALRSLNSTLGSTTKSASDAASAMRNFGNAVNSVNIKSIPQQINASAKAVSALDKASSSSSRALANASSEMVEFGKQAGLAVRRFAAFSAVTSVIYGITNSINQGVQSFIDYDKQLTRIQQVTGESAQGLTKLQGQITNLSTSLGVSSKELTNVALTLAQAGLSARDTERALKALALSSLAPSFDDMNETVEGSIALMRQFGINAKDLEQSLGAVNAVAAKFAVESSDIITAIQRTGSVFATASKGVSEGKDALNEFIAVFTSVRATTRESAETIATGLRTIFTRIQRGSTINALKEFGVNLTDAQGKFVGAYKAVELLSQGLSKIDPRSLDFSRIIEELGGFRQIGKVIPLIQQFAVAQDALSVAQKGQGSLARDAVTAQKSLANQISKVREEFLALFREIGSSKSFQTIVRGALDLTSALIKVTSSLKGLLPALTILMAFKGVKALTQFTSGFSTGVRKGPDNKEGSGSRPFFNRGGMVRKFARGGLVPGQGDGDTVPAMLEPGEFVIRKKAVQTIGADNLHQMNKYGSGGSIRAGSSSRRQKFKDGDIVRKVFDETNSGSKLQKSHIGEDIVLSKQQIQNYASKYKNSKFQRSVAEAGYDIKDIASGNFDLEDFINTMGLKAKERVVLNLPTSFNQALRKNDRDLVSADGLVKFITKSNNVFTGKSRYTNEVFKKPDLIKAIRGLSPTPYSDSDKPNIPAFDMDSELNPLKSIIADDINQNQLDLLFKPSSIDAKYTSRKTGMTRLRTQSRTTASRSKLDEPIEQKFAGGGKVLRNLGYIDYDVIANEANKDAVEKGMKSTGSTGPRIYADKLTELAIKARKNSSIEKLRAVYGVAGSGKTTLARGQGTDNATLRQTNRFPILTPEDIDRANEILILSSSVSKDKLESLFAEADRTYTLSSTTKAERERIKNQRTSRDTTGIGLEGRQPGTTSGVSTDTAVGEALLGNALGNRSVVLGRSTSGKLRRKTGNELVDIVKKKVAFTWGGFAPTTSGHESIMDAAAAMGFAPEDFIALVGANEGIKAGDPSSYRTAVFDQDFRVLLAKAGFGARGATVLPKPRDFEVPQAFDISREGADRRQVLIPKKGSRAFVADKTPEQTAKYKEAGYAVSNIERTGGISGTMVRDLIMSGNMAKLQKVLSPGVYELVSDNIGRLRNRANALPDIIEQVKASHGASIADLDKEIEALGIKRIDAKKVASDPEYAAKAQLLEELRAKKKKIQSSASFEPYRLLAQLAKAQPDKYGLNVSRGAPSLSDMSGVSKLSTAQMKNMGGLIRQFQDAGVASATGGRALSRSEILKVLGTEGAAKAAGISATQVYSLLGIRNPDEKQKALREAIETEYVKKVNRKAGAAQGTTTKLQNRGLEFAAAGLFGKAFSPENIDINSDKLSRSAKVRVLSGVMKQSAAEKIESIFQAGSQNLAQQAADAIRGEYQEAGSAIGTSIFNTNTEASIQGGLLEKAIQILGGPGATKGQGFDFPNGLQGAAKYFGLPGDVPTDLKRTLAGASTIKDNIITYLKNVLGYASGGQVGGLSFEDIRKQIIDKYPDIDFRISKRKKGRGFGYNLLGALKSDGGLLKSKGLKFEQPVNLKQLLESSDKIAQSLMNPKEFALGGLADASAEMSNLMTNLYGNRSDNQNIQTKKEKQFGKIALRSDGQTISATYFKNDQRSGNVSAYKMRDYLYYVGLSQATSGYGPRLYDAVMEEATAKGAMLTSDRSSVSGAAKKVWEYYFKNRGDVKKTPLKPDDWTRNQADIDPKLYGAPDTWPPATDPAWILQSGYNKNPSLINDPTAVIRMGDQNDSRSMALQYFQRKALGGLIRRFAEGGASEDTVPALLTPGEFVINRKAAQSIGYNRLEKLNHADKIKGYNTGGIVGGIAHFAAGGGVGIPMFDWLSKLAKNYDRRPDTVSRATVGVDDKTLDSVKKVVQALNDMGISANKTAEILNAGGRTTYKELEKAMTKDIERLRIAGASIDQIVIAERTLASVRKKAKADIGKESSLNNVFTIRNAKSKRIIGGATTTSDLMEGSAAGQQAIDMQAKMLADARMKRLGGKASAQQRTKIYEESYLDAASRVTGVSKKDFKKEKISGSDIQRYITESMKDRKTLAQMDKQLVEIKLQEKRNSTEYLAASANEQRAMLAMVRKEAEEEISVRREIINKLAAQNGEVGVGGTGMFDFRNSPVLNAVKDRYVAKKGEPSLMGLKGTALSDVALATGAIGGQGKNIAKLMYNTGTEGGQKQAVATGAGIEQAGTTLSAGLMAASQALTIPVVGPWIAGLTAVGTAAFAAADYFYDFTGSQKAAVLELEKSLNASKLEDATDKLDKAFSDFESDMSNIDLQKALGKAFTEYNRASSQSAVTELKDADFKAGQSRGWLAWAVGAPKPTIDNDKMNELSRSEANRNAAASNKAASYIRAQINTGTTDINALAQNQEVVKAYGSGDVEVQKEVNNRLAIMAEKVGGINNVTAEQRDKILLEVSTRKFLNDEQIKAAIKSKELADAMEDADRAGRKLAQSFQKLFSSINQSINRIKFESDQRKKLAAARTAGLNGQMAPLTGVSEANRTMNVLQNRNAYTPEEYKQAVSSTASMVPGEAGTRLAEAANLDATLGDTLKSVIASAVGKSKGTSVDEAKEAAIRASAEAIDKMNVSDEIKQALKAQAKAQIDTAASKANEASAGDQTRALDIFTDNISQSANVIGEFTKGAQETLQNLAELKAAQFDAFIEGINESAKASKEAASLFKKSRDLMAQGQRTVKEVLTGQTESYDDVKARMMGDVAGLTGGITDPTAIRQKVVNMSNQQEQKQKDLAAVVNNPASTDADKKRASEQYRDFTVGLSNAKEALDMLADSTELVNKALEDLKAATQMQAQRENFVNQLLTNTPEEADKLNQTFIRLQRNLSGGFNNAFNQRDARKAYNDTLRQTGNIREATRAGNTVLANQRKETLALMKDSGFRATIGLQMGMQNPNVSEADITKKLNDMELQLMKQMATESGMMNNPLVRQAIAAKEDPKADPMVKARADRYLEAVGLQSKATKEQAELKAIESTEALKNSNMDLKASIDSLAKVITDATGRDRAVEEGSAIPGGDRKVALNLPGASPLGAQQAAKGGIIYASSGRLINFEPQGTDTVPAMLSPGEFVINAQATAQHLPLLQAINDGQANIVSKGLSKGGIVYLAQGGRLKKDETIAQDRAALDAEVQAQGAAYVAGNEESQRDQTELATLQQKNQSAEFKDYVTRNTDWGPEAQGEYYAQFYANRNNWFDLSDEQKAAEIKKYQDLAIQEHSANYSRIKTADPRLDSFGAPLANHPEYKKIQEENQKALEEARLAWDNKHREIEDKKGREGSAWNPDTKQWEKVGKYTYTTPEQQARYNDLERRNTLEYNRQIAYGEKAVSTRDDGRLVIKSGGVEIVPWKPGEREAYIESKKKEAIDAVNKEEAKQGLPLTQYESTAARAPNNIAAGARAMEMEQARMVANAASAEAAARASTNKSAATVEDPFGAEMTSANGMVGPMSPDTAAMLSVSAPTAAAQDQAQSGSVPGMGQMNPRDFKPRNAAEARIARQAWAMGMTPAEFRYARQQAYINKAGSAEMRAQRAAQFGKGLLEPSARQAAMQKQQDEAAKLQANSSTSTNGATGQPTAAKPNAPPTAMSLSRADKAKLLALQNIDPLDRSEDQQLRYLKLRATQKGLFGSEADSFIASETRAQEDRLAKRYKAIQAQGESASGYDLEFAEKFRQKEADTRSAVLAEAGATRSTSESARFAFSQAAGNNRYRDRQIQRAEEGYTKKGSDGVSRQDLDRQELTGIETRRVEAQFKQKISELNTNPLVANLATGDKAEAFGRMMAENSEGYASLRPEEQERLALHYGKMAKDHLSSGEKSGLPASELEALAQQFSSEKGVPPFGISPKELIDFKFQNEREKKLADIHSSVYGGISGADTRASAEGAAQLTAQATSLRAAAERLSRMSTVDSSRQIAQLTQQAAALEATAGMTTSESSNAALAKAKDRSITSPMLSGLEQSAVASTVQKATKDKTLGFYASSRQEEVRIARVEQKKQEALAQAAAEKAQREQEAAAQAQAQAQAAENARLAAEEKRQREKAERDKYWINSSNPLVAIGGYLGGLGQSGGRAIQGATTAVGGAAYATFGAGMQLADSMYTSEEEIRTQQIDANYRAMQERRIAEGTLTREEVDESRRRELASVGPTTAGQAVTQLGLEAMSAGLGDVASVPNALVAGALNPEEYMGESYGSQFRQRNIDNLRNANPNERFLGLSGATAAGVTSAAGYTQVLTSEGTAVVAGGGGNLGTFGNAVIKPLTVGDRLAGLGIGYGIQGLSRIPGVAAGGRALANSRLGRGVGGVFNYLGEVGQNLRLGTGRNQSVFRGVELPRSTRGARAAGDWAGRGADRVMDAFGGFADEAGGFLDVARNMFTSRGRRLAGATENGATSFRQWSNSMRGARSAENTENAVRSIRESMDVIDYATPVATAQSRTQLAAQIRGLRASGRNTAARSLGRDALGGSYRLGDDVLQRFPTTLDDIQNLRTRELFNAGFSERSARPVYNPAQRRPILERANRNARSGRQLAGLPEVPRTQSQVISDIIRQEQDIYGPAYRLARQSEAPFTPYGTLADQLRERATSIANRRAAAVKYADRPSPILDPNVDLTLGPPMPGSSTRTRGPFSISPSSPTTSAASSALDDILPSARGGLSAAEREAAAAAAQADAIASGRQVVPSAPTIKPRSATPIVSTARQVSAAELQTNGVRILGAGDAPIYNQNGRLYVGQPGKGGKRLYQQDSGEWATGGGLSTPYGPMTPSVPRPQVTAAPTPKSPVAPVTTRQQVLANAASVKPQTASQIRGNTPSVTKPKPSFDSPDYVEYYSARFANSPFHMEARRLLARQQMVHSRINAATNAREQQQKANEAWKAFLKRMRAEGYSSGGIIYANNGALAAATSGSDTVPAMLTPGEFVVNREAAQTYMPILHAINSGHFNRGGIVNYLANGGVVAPKYYAEGTQFPIQRPSSGGGVSNNVGIDIGAAISQALGSAVGQLSEFASNLTTGLQQTMEQYGQVSQTISQSVATFSESANKMESSAQTYGEAAANTPSKLVATVTGSVMTNHTGLDKLTGNIEKDIYTNTAKQSSTISQNSIAHVDKTAYEGGLNSSANAKPMGMA